MREYQALYRKWRPQRFEDVVGQKHIIRTLQNAIRSGNIAHAYLFCGPRGSGKTTTARLLAKALNCEKGPTPEPCNECSICQAIADGRAMDIIEMDAASSTSVEDARELRETVKLAPVQARYKFYIIDEVHRLSRAAFDALLKTLEEPPPNVIFVLATTEPNKVPSTIASRCQRFDFHRGSEKEIKEYLKKVCKEEGIEIDDDALSLIVTRAEGSWRDALSLLEQVWAYSSKRITAQTVEEVLGIIAEETLARFLKAVATGEVREGIQIVGEILDSGKDPREFLHSLSKLLRDLLILKIGGAQLLDVEEAKKRALLELANYFAHNVLLQMLEIVLAQENILRLSPSPRLPLEMLFARLLQITGNLKETEKQEIKPEIIKEEVEEKISEERTSPPPQAEEKQEKEEKPVPAIAAAGEPEKSSTAESKEEKEEKAPTGTPIELTDILTIWEEVLDRLYKKEGASNLFAAFKKGVRPIAVDENFLTLGFPSSFDFIRKRFENDQRKHKVLLSVLQSFFPNFSLRFKTQLIEEETPTPKEEKSPREKNNLKGTEAETIESAETIELEDEREKISASEQVLKQPENEVDEELKLFKETFPEAEPLD